VSETPEPREPFALSVAGRQSTPLAALVPLRPLDPSARAWIAQRTEQLFRDAGALRAGHFALKSGRHGDRYVEKFQVLQAPATVTELCGFVAERVRDEDGSAVVDVVAGPTTGGIILAFEAARQLGVRGIFAEEVRSPDGTVRREFRRGFRIGEGERVLVLDDILTTGGSLHSMLPAIEASGGRVAHVAVVVDRSGGLSEIRSPASGRLYPAEALWALELPTFEAGPGTCPGCRDGLPLESPGAAGTSIEVRPPASSG
jgi:orotate phosphoribosyltransferase